MKNRWRWSTFFLAFALILGIASGAASATSIYVLKAPYNDGRTGTWVNDTTDQGPGNPNDRLRVGGDGSGNQYQSFLAADLSGAPRVASQVTWVVDLYEDFGGDGDWAELALCLNLDTWQVSTVSWTNMPGAPTCNVLVPVPDHAGLYSIDVTDEYNQWRTGRGQLNFGATFVPYPNSPVTEAFSSFWGNNNGPPVSPEFRDGPYLVIKYNAALAINDPKWVLWPLGTPYASRQISGAWAGNSEIPCSGGGYAQHAGVDYAAPAGTAVYASEDGYVEEITCRPNEGCGVVLSHRRPPKLAGFATSVYWHIDVTASLQVGHKVPKGFQIGTVTDIERYGYPVNHLHWGVRYGVYTPGLSGLEGLTKKNTVCDGLPPWQSGFFNPENPQLIKPHE